MQVDTDAPVPGLMSSDPEINDSIVALYSEMLKGDPSKQGDIDSYILPELILRNKKRAALLRSCTNGSVVEQLQSPDRFNPHRDTLPDLGNFIRTVVFFSGDRPSETQLNSPVSCYIYEALPNIKRTKQVKHKLKLKKMQEEPNNTSAIISVMVGTLLALFPGCAKSPDFKLRCRIMEMMHGIQCMTLNDKSVLLDSTPSLVKLCFMEYVPWFIQAYMPVEKQIIERSATTAIFTRTCPNICDMFRQEINQLEILDFHHLNKLAGQAIERCTRLCKFKMQRHVHAKESTIAYPAAVKKETFQRAIELLAPNGHRHPVKRTKGHGAPPLDTTKELHIFYPSVSDHASITCASILHQHLQVAPLPANIAAEQLATINRLYSHCSLIQEAASAFHVCATCILQGRMTPPKFRMSLTKNLLQCDTCKNDFSVLKIDLVGAVIYFGGRAIAMCPGCANTTMNHGDGSVFSGCCCSCRTKKCAADTRTRKMCARCPSTSIAGTLRLLNSQTMQMEETHLCAKHMPNTSLQKYVHEVSQLKSIK